MKLEHDNGNLKIRYDFSDEQLSLIIHNEEDDSETQINLNNNDDISKLHEIIEMVEAIKYKMGENV